MKLKVNKGAHMGKTRCKMVCTSKAMRESLNQNPSYDVTFQPVQDGSAENKKFWEFTPSGHLGFNSVNAGGFEVGKEYYVDISPAFAQEEAVAIPESEQT